LPVPVQIASIALQSLVAVIVSDRAVAGSYEFLSSWAGRRQPLRRLCELLVDCPRDYKD